MCLHFVSFKMTLFIIECILFNVRQDHRCTLLLSTKQLINIFLSDREQLKDKKQCNAGKKNNKI